MTRLEFKSELSRRLEAIPFTERQKPLEYYDEMICDRMEEGMSEEEAVAAMGSLDDIAAEILSGIPVPPQTAKNGNKADASNSSAKKPLLSRNALIMIIIVLSIPIWTPLLGAAVGILLAIIGTVLSILFTIGLIYGAIAITGGIGTVYAVWLCFTSPLIYGLLNLGVALIFVGLAVVLLPLVIMFYKWIAGLIVKLFNKIRITFERRKSA